MNLSIVTPVYNDPRVRHCLESVHSQKGDFEIEHIVVDSQSTDETVEILEEYEEHIDILIRESDDGVYDAMNKGVQRASGDVVGILNADDRYQDNHVVEDVITTLDETGAGVCFGDLVYVDDSDEVVRFWRSGPYRKWKFYLGWMPPHPTFFVRRKLYEQFGHFDQEFSIAADYEFMLRLLVMQGVSAAYLDRVLVRMALGGQSNASVKNMLSAIEDMYRSWKKHNSSGRFIAPIMHPLEKAPQYVMNPPSSVKSVKE